MKVLKWFFVFMVAFLAACILIFTFSQEPFRTLVPARLLAWRTPAIPIYAYVGGAFGCGLLLGLLMVLYNYIVYQAKMHRKNHTIADLETQLSDARQTLERNGLAAPGNGGNVEEAGNTSVHPSKVTDEHDIPGGAT